MIIKRDSYLTQIISGKGNGLIKIITGIRRCGKSFLLFDLFHRHLIEQGIDENHIIKIAFDDWDFRELCDPAKMMEYVKSHIVDEAIHYILLDEVQLLDEFVPVLNGLLRKKNLDIYVTGSNSRFLSTDVVTEFRGRGDQIHVYPLSFSEFMSVRDDHPMEAWNEYYTYGGLPHVLALDTDKKKSDYLRNLYQTVYVSDILERQNIRNKEEFNELVNIIASSIGSPTNPRKLSNTFKSLKNKILAQPTISKYLTYLQDAFIVEKAIRYDIKGKKYINTLSKYYFSDVGIRNAILDFRQQEENHIMENIIYNELKIRGFHVDIGVVEHKTTDKNGKTIRKQYEVDFVANQGSQRYYIQSAFVMPTDAKERQESASLLNIDDSFKKIIIVKDYIKPKRNEDGIVTIGLIDFLLKQELLGW
ncbi:ATP-binding protein [Bacteroides acidifaciens]|uniref:ATP-binding protein n=1 Tax=Bacteroides acidifaciens TaxID=85831 RepID=UPI002612F390|nr:ATP-binding protein [Bacteroides acidifaciens]